MSKTVIKVENLSKQYRLGQVGTGTISHDLNRWWARVRGKEDPYLKIGETNDRATKGDSQYVWALQDINFEVKEGEVLGIIGKNGAGKSTLLKILSKVTGPTTGSIKAKGRIASLLEVGTGFHPELTGRENIYLNGTILGMTKTEVKAKLDEIVDFAGVERYLDTPVKRYSSGMMVRLGFAVAAHLEPEILIVDEVLAVGDAEFQKKAIGKMQEVSQGQGRTVLFVSHNMESVLQLCSKVILLKDGNKIDENNPAQVVEKYLNLNREKAPKFSDNSALKSLALKNSDNQQKLDFNFEEEIIISTKLNWNEIPENAAIGITVKNRFQNRVFTFEKYKNEFEYLAGGDLVMMEMKIPGHILASGNYFMTFSISIPNQEIIEFFEDVFTFSVIYQNNPFVKYGKAHTGDVILPIGVTLNKG